MRIGIDARFLGLKVGIGRYTEKLIEHLEKNDNQNDYFIFVKKQNFNLYCPTNKRFHRVLADDQWYSFREQIFFPHRLYKQRLDLVHFLHFNVPLLYFGKFIITIHDLTQRNLTKEASKLPWLFFLFKKAAYRLIIWSALRRSEKIITVSNFTKQQIIKYYNVNPEKISVVYESC
ncbi:MAG: glycosyltransferase [Patescibacteria group bacterium]|nr:glycosyltransferase [Patescibacteria group bacterium]